MATAAVAQETVFALRQKIAKIEGRLAERLDGRRGFGQQRGRSASPSRARRARTRPSRHRRRTVRRSPRRRPAARSADRNPRPGNTRRRRQPPASPWRLSALLLAPRQTPMLWIGTSEIFREAGFPYALGMQSLYEHRPRPAAWSRRRRSLRMRCGSPRKPRG